VSTAQHQGSAFYEWVHRLRQSGEIDIPAVIPTVIRKESEQPDIVKIKIEGEKRIATAPKPVLTPKPPVVTFTSMQTQPGYPVMEVINSNVHLRVTNDVKPVLLAETIRLLRSSVC